ncbi:MAG: hypothetical protein EAX86_12440 [Candidatus Heimdallarchaeota archaeon]|nr:hypothetical protein [Candidatus Heimdallarchaeota archaeon]
MDKTLKRQEYLSTRSLFKAAIRFLLFRYGELTAKEIQEKFGLKRQTTYNYLKELAEENKIEVKYEKVPDRPNLSVAIYSFNCQQLLSHTEDSLTETIAKEAEEHLSISIRRMHNAIDSSLGALLELKAAFNRMSDEEIENYVKCDPIGWGFFSMTLLLTDTEYNELIEEFQTLINRLNRKWTEKKENQVSHSGNVFTFTFYKRLS